NDRTVQKEFGATMPSVGHSVMSNLLLRTFSQGLQAFLPIAVALAWLRGQNDANTSAAVRLGLLVALPTTVPASWYFQRTSHRALDEMFLAASALAIAYVFERRVWHRLEAIQADEPVGHHGLAFWAAMAASSTIVLRQTMEIGSTFLTAAFDVR